MEKLTVFVDPNFLRSFLKKKVELIEEGFESEAETWFNLYGFIKNKCKINLYVKHLKNIDLTYVPENSFVRLLFEKYYQGSDEITFVEEFPESIENIDYKSIENFKFIFSSNESLKCIEEKFGVVVLTTSSFITSWKIYAQKSGLDVLKSSKNVISEGWRILDKFKHPLHSILFTERHLFGYYWNIENNLFPLLKALLSDQKLDIPFDLTILTEKIYKNNRTQKEEACITVYNRIEHFLKHEMGFHSINLTLCKVPEDLGPRIHDRQLFTNYFFITSGMGFGCFNQYGQSTLPSSTTIEIIPITNFDISHKDFVVEKKEILESPGATLIGPNINRLFEI